jgi:hypothetical protein
VPVQHTRNRTQHRNAQRTTLRSIFTKREIPK